MAFKVPSYQTTEKLNPLPNAQIGQQATPDMFGASVAAKGADIFAKITADIQQKREETAMFGANSNLESKRSRFNEAATLATLDSKNGKITSEQLQERIAKESDEIFKIDIDLSRLPAHGQEKYITQLENLKRDSGVQLLKTIDAAATVDRNNVKDAADNNFLRQASEANYEQAFTWAENYTGTKEWNEANFSIHGANAEKYKIQYKANIGINNGKYLIEAMGTLEQADMMLEAVREDKGSFGYLTADNKESMASDINRKRNQIEARIKQEQEKKNKEIEKMLSDFDGDVYTGFPISLDKIQTIENVVKGTEHEQAFKEQKGMYTFSQEYQGKSPEEQSAIYNNLLVQAKNTPTGDPKGVKKKIDFINRLNEESTKLRNDNPLAYIDIKTGQQPDYLNPATLLGDGSQISLQLKDRAMRSNNNQIFRPEEVEIFKQQLPKYSNEQKLNIFGNLSKTFSGNPAALNKAMTQLGSDDPIMAMAGMLYGKDVVYGDNLNSKEVSRMVLSGQESLKKKEIKMPTEKDFSDYFSSSYGKVYRGVGNVASVHYDSAKALYASMSVKDGDYNGDFNSARWKKALAATGGEISSIGSSNVIVPIGMSKDVFEDRIASTANHMAANGGVSDKYKNEFKYNKLPSGLSLEQISETRYTLNVGLTPLTDNKGQRVIIDVMKPKKYTQPMRDAPVFYEKGSLEQRQFPTGLR